MKRPSANNVVPVAAGSTDEDLRPGGVRRRGRTSKRSEGALFSKPAPAPQVAGASRASSAEGRSSVGALEIDGVSARIAALTTLGMQALRSEWRRLTRREPPRLSRDQMMRVLAYRIQENAFGGPPPAIERRLAKLMKEFESEGRVVARPPPKVKPGARLVREWRGRTHVVSVVDAGFEYQGKTFPSLTAVAVEITGAHWSGPRFFGLVRRKGAKTSAEEGDIAGAAASESGAHDGGGRAEGEEETADA